MYNEHNKDGLEIISLDLDKPSAAIRSAVLGFLKDVKAGYPNLVLADGEDAEEWFEKKLNTSGVPYLRVYDRSGKIVKVYEDASYHDELDRVVLPLLKQK